MVSPPSSSSPSMPLVLTPNPFLLHFCLGMGRSLTSINKIQPRTTCPWDGSIDCGLCQLTSIISQDNPSLTDSDNRPVETPFLGDSEMCHIDNKW